MLVMGIFPNLPKIQRSEIKQAVHFNKGIDCSGEHSYQVWTKSDGNPRRSDFKIISMVDSGDQTVDEKGYQ